MLLYNTLPSLFVIIVAINFTNAQILGLDKLQSCHLLTACPVMDLLS